MEANVKKGIGSGNYQNYILTLLVLAVNVLLLGFCFDFYYDLNDDTMMLDIMAGLTAERRMDITCRLYIRWGR